jgi:transcription elongation factor/antiterminator RfaH
MNLRALSQSMAATSRRWYLAQTLPHKEGTAQMQLEAQGFHSFLPRRPRTVRHARQLRTVNAPLFPRYLFVSLDLGRDRWRSVNGTIGVAGLFMVDDRPAPVPVGVVEDLIQSANSVGRMRSAEDLQPGQKVRLTAGPLAHALGILERLDDRGRVEVLLEIMGGRIRTSAALEWVERLG